MKRTVLALPFALALAACVEAPETGVEEAAVKTVSGDPCPVLGCSNNSAFLGPTEFHELSEVPTDANREGFHLRGMVKNGVTWSVDVTGTVLTGYRFTFVGGLLVYQQLAGANLKDAELIVENDDGRSYLIRIVNASTVQKLWQPAGTTAAVNTYELKWKQVGGASTDYVPVCKNPPNRELEDGPLQTLTEAILFTGDRYDTDKLTVTAINPTEAGRWFNIGCAGSVLAKLALNRHTYATMSSDVTTSRAQRQAMLKMYTSDICGTGDALTVSGTPLRWWSKTGLQNKAIVTYSREALWNDGGAICLDVHRLHGTPEGDSMYKQIEAACETVGRRVPAPCADPPSVWDFRTESQAPLL